jgi:hypothetical protein|nr:MAG TPA: hypothetical protein [Herelleviridae sp.]
MSITFSGTTDNSNFDYIVNQTTPNYRVLSPPPAGGQTIKTVNNQKVVFKDETLITTPEKPGSNSPNINTNFGRDSEITFDSCNILINHSFKQRRVTEGKVNFINSNILVLPDNGRINFAANMVEGLHLHVRRRSAGEQVFLYTNPGTIIRGLPGKPNLFEGMWCLELAKGVKLNDITFKNCGPNLLNWNAGNIGVRGLNLYDGTPKENSVDCDAWINTNGNNTLTFFSCKLRLDHVNNAQDGKACRFVCINESFNISDAKIRYKMKADIPSVAKTFTTTNGTLRSDAITKESIYSDQFVHLENKKLKKTVGGDVLPYIDLLTEVTTNVRESKPTGVLDPTSVTLPNTEFINWTRTIRHPTIKTYVNDIENQVEDIGATLGTPTIAAEVKLTLDEEYRPIENSGTCAFAMSGEKINVVVNGIMSTQDIYNKWKEFLYTDEGFEFDESLITAKNGILTIKGDATIRAAITAPRNANDLQQIIATGTITVDPNVTIAVPYADINSLGSIEIIGIKGHTVRIKKVSDRSVILETPIQKKNSVIIGITSAMIAEPIYITKVATDGLTQAGTSAIQLVKGVNDPVQLYSGEQVQITNIDDLSKIKKGLTQINGGVKKASMLIPYTDDLETT